MNISQGDNFPNKHIPSEIVVNVRTRHVQRTAVCEAFSFRAASDKLQAYCKRPEEEIRHAADQKLGPAQAMPSSLG
jgi:hypothetical protein